MKNVQASSEGKEIPSELFIIVAEHHRQFDKESFKLNIGISRFNVSLRFYFPFHVNNETVNFVACISPEAKCV